MRRFTTPTLPMTVPVDLTGADVYVTIKQSGRLMIKKTGEDVTAVYNAESGKTELAITLTQEETGHFFSRSEALIQVNWIFNDGTRDATNIKKIEVDDNLLNEVIQYGD